MELLNLPSGYTQSIEINSPYKAVIDITNSDFNSTLTDLTFSNHFPEEILMQVETILNSRPTVTNGFSLTFYEEGETKRVTLNGEDFEDGMELLNLPNGYTQSVEINSPYEAVIDITSPSFNSSLASLTFANHLPESIIMQVETIILYSSCSEILEKDSTKKSGVYKINLGGVLTEVYCDMENDGGGWTYCAGFDPKLTDDLTHHRDIFTNSYNSLELNGSNDGFWSLNCVSLKAALGASKGMFVTSQDKWWSFDLPDISNFYAKGVYNSGSLNDEITGRDTNTNLVDFRIDFDGSCQYGTGSHSWHILDFSQTSCASQTDDGGIMIRTKPDGFSQYSHIVECGDSYSDTQNSCDNAWVYMGLK